MLLRKVLLCSALVLLLIGLAAPTQAQSTTGQWSSLQTWPYRGVHINLLPNGKVLFWSYYSEALNPQIWDPVANTVTAAKSVSYSLFCAGHSFLADGRVFVTGGHIADYTGYTHTIIYDWRNNTWTAGPEMNAGRWYPTNTTLPNGNVLIISGDINSNTNVDTLPQVYNPGTNTLTNLSTATLALPLYPRMFVAPNGKVFYAGPNSPSRYLSTSGTGSWSSVGNLVHSPRDYGSAVMYDVGKIIYMGGGGSSTSSTPQATAEIINLNSSTPAWISTGSMHNARRQMNGTVLPDGTVLASGGGSCGGFDPSNCPVYTPEIWNPATGTFTSMAGDPAQVYRGYHSTAILLPDGRVLSAGGNVGGPNASLFSPPYLFKGARPTISSAPSGINYGQTFFVGTPNATSITKIGFIKMGAVTHANNYDQRYIPLTIAQASGGLNITAPANANIAPPGYYMLFLVNSSGVPSVAAITQICSSCSSGGTVTTGTITGAVTDAATTSPINGATVSAGGVSTSSASDGTYTLSNVPAGASVTVTASAAGYQSSSQSVALSAGGTATASFALVSTSTSGTGSVTGTVTDANTKAGITGATVSGGGQTTTTASGGAYTLSNVPAGTAVTITASATGYQSAQQSVTLTSGGSATANFALTPITTGTISGGVFKTSDGTAISGATVSGGGVSATTNASGAYTLNNVPTGAVSVTASASGFQSSTQTVTVTAGTTIQANFSLAAATTGTGTVTGTVTSLKTGAALSGATVSYSGGTATATTNSSGVYTLSGIPAGTYTFTAKASGYLNRSATASVTSGATTTLNFQLSTAGKIGGTVTNSSGAAVSGVTITVTGGQIATTVTLTTSSTGQYLTGWIPIGTYTVTASASGHTTQSKSSISVSAGVTTTVNFTNF